MEDLFREQRELQKLLGFEIDTDDPEEKRRLTKEYLLHISSEFSELLNATGSWKTNVEQDEKPKKFGICEELVDVLKFLVNIALVWNITPEDLIEVSKEKHIVNEYKFMQEKRIEQLEDEPKIIVDIDGVLNNYFQDFLDFVEQQTSKSYDSYKSFKEKTAPKEYLKLKHKFRDEGLETSCSVNEEARSFVNSRDEKIILMTSRPTSNYKQQYYETLNWLKNNKIKYDLLLFEKEKGLVSMKFDNVKYAIEDSIPSAIEIAEWGIDVFLLTEHDVSYPHVICVQDFKNIEKHL